VGLTIHYEWQLPAARAAELPALLAALADIARRNNFVEVGEPMHLVGDACQAANASDESMFELLFSVERDGADDTSEAPEELFLLATRPGAGCEAATFGFARFADGGWTWKSWCKTSFAAAAENGGLINFLRSHTRLIKALDEIRALGIDVDVSDDTGYWESRDRKELQRAIEAYQVVISLFAGGARPEEESANEDIWVDDPDEG
jgi:hypothetical protein